MSSATLSTKPSLCIGIISIGDMGSGVARLLLAHGFRVVTNVHDRSPATQARAARLNIVSLASDVELYQTADVILSIVPPRDALDTAERIILACKSQEKKKARTQPLFYLDLNAISPTTARAIAAKFEDHSADIRAIDGGIIGGPPRLLPSEDSQVATPGKWYRPSIPVSGPHKLSDLGSAGAFLAEVLNVRDCGNDIGTATGLKMCFAGITKGFVALCTQSFTTAHSLGVLQELRDHLGGAFPDLYQSAEKGMVSMPPKAYRWVAEMDEIAATFEDDGGFTSEESIFRAVARTYDLIAHGTDLGQETIENRTRGKTSADVARAVSEGTIQRKSRDTRGV